MVFYKAYFDESGHPDDSDHLTVAGCIAEAVQWIHFEREWKLALRPLGTEIFHAADFYWRNPPYHKLSDAEADELFQRLVGIICRRIEKSISQTVQLTSYNIINDKYLFAESYGFPYPAVARRCMLITSEWAEHHSIPGDQLLIFFEDGAKHKGQIEWIAERDGLRVPIFLKKRNAVPLQAADLLAWCANFYLNNHATTLPKYERAIERLSKVSNEWGVLNLGEPDRIPTILQIPLRDHGMQYKCKIINKGGKRRALIHYWPKHIRREPEADRKALNLLPEPKVLSTAEIERAIAEYDAARNGKPRSTAIKDMQS